MKAGSPDHSARTSEHFAPTVLIRDADVQTLRHFATRDSATSKLQQ